MTKIKRIHDFGPKVGEWTSHATVAETIAAEFKRLKKQSESGKPNVVTPIKRNDRR